MQGMENFTITSDNSNAEDHSVKTACYTVSPHGRWMLEVIGFWDFSHSYV